MRKGLATLRERVAIKRRASLFEGAAFRFERHTWKGHTVMRKTIGAARGDPAR